MNSSWKNLVEDLKKKGALKTPEIISAFEKIDRADFVVGEYKNSAYVDTALPIGEGQTISQPYTVAFMLELLQPKGGDKILDIGSGSGWQTALLAQIVGSTGKIYAVEIIPRLYEFGKRNTAKYNFVKKGIVKFICGNGSKKETFDSIGDEIYKGVDKIIAAAAIEEKVPELWFGLLKPKGRMVVPIKNSLYLFVKNHGGKIEQKEYPGFVFVPFV